MSWSAAEIAALAEKAARGAGAPAGQAARFGPVVAIHLMAGRSDTSLRVALEALPTGPVLDLPVALDAALATAEAAAGITVSAPPDLVQSYVDALPLRVAATQVSDRHWQLEIVYDQPQLRLVPVRITDAETLIAQMTKLAEKTFVPESEASRGAGAGAGLTDND